MQMKFLYVSSCSIGTFLLLYQNLQLSRNTEPLSNLPPLKRKTFMQQLNILIFLGVYNTHINRIQENQVTGQEH